MKINVLRFKVVNTHYLTSGYLTCYLLSHWLNRPSLVKYCPYVACVMVAVPVVGCAPPVVVAVPVVGCSPAVIV